MCASLFALLCVYTQVGVAQIYTSSSNHMIASDTGKGNKSFVKVYAFLFLSWENHEAEAWSSSDACLQCLMSCEPVKTVLVWINELLLLRPEQGMHVGGCILVYAGHKQCLQKCVSMTMSRAPL